MHCRLRFFTILKVLISSRDLRSSSTVSESLNLSGPSSHLEIYGWLLQLNSAMCNVIVAAHAMLQTFKNSLHWSLMSL